MADAMDTPSLVGMISATGGKAQRESGESRFKTAKSGDAGDASHTAADGKRGGFDGFLNAFLGKDKAGNNTGAADSSRSGKAHSPGKAPGKSSGKAGAPTLSEHLDNAEKPSRKGGSGKVESPDRAVGRMAAEDRRALRESMEKTVAADAESAGNAAENMPEEYPPDVVAAAEEAAALIWNLLYGQTEALPVAIPPVAMTPGQTDDMPIDMPIDLPIEMMPADAASPDMVFPDTPPADVAPVEMADAESRGGDALKALASHIGNARPDNVFPDSALNGMGAEGAVDLSALQDAIDTANASAEMNSAAVLSALDELLDGMPRAALADALSRAAEAMGLPAADVGEGDVFNRIAAALGAEVVDVGGGEAALLSFLGGAAVHSDATVTVDVAAQPETAQAEVTQPAAVKTVTAPPVGAAPSADAVIPADVPVAADMAPLAGAPVAAALPSPTDVPAVAALEPLADVPVIDVMPSPADASIPAGMAPPADAPVAAGMAPPADAPVAAGMAPPADAPVATDMAPPADAPVAADMAPPVDAEKEPAPAPEQGNTAETDTPENTPEAAENSGKFPATDATEGEVEVTMKDLTKLFREFLEENPEAIGQDDGDVATAAKDPRIVQHFADWLSGNGNMKAAKQLAVARSESSQPLAQRIAEELEMPVASGEKLQRVDPEREVYLQGVSKGTGNAADATEQKEAKTFLAFGKPASPVEASAPNNVVGVHGQNTLTPAAARHGTANPSSMSTMLDQMENIERLSEAMKMNARNGVKNLTLQLSPPELGKVMLRVESVNGTINAYLRVEKPEAAAQLGSALDQLRQTLKEQGIEVGEMSLRQQGANEALGDFSGQRHNGREAHESRERGRGRNRRGGRGVEDAETDAPAAVFSGRAGPGALNLFA